MNSIPSKTNKADNVQFLKLVSEALDHAFIAPLKSEAKCLGADVYLVGGAVRDLVLQGELPDDLDFMVVKGSGHAETLARNIADKLQGSYVLLDESFGIHRVVKDGFTLDISDALENSLEKDLARRDLTVNAMAVNIATGEFLDPYDGLSDLKNKTIRMISEKNMIDDPLRLFRVYRMAAKIQAESIHPDTISVVKKHRDKILIAAPERIHYEFFRMLSVSPCYPYLIQMGESGLLEVILPELIATREVPPNLHHHLGLYDHTLELVNQTERLLPTLSESAQEELLENFNPFVTRLGLVKLACLLHDIGKPETMEVKDAGPEGVRKVTFYGHDAVSETMTETIFKRWRAGNQMGEQVKKLVRWHLYPCQFGQNSPRKSVLRFFRRMGEQTPDVILLAMADRASTRGPEITDDIFEKSMADHRWLLEQYYIEAETLSLPRLLNGNDIMGILGISPGPKIKEILEALTEAQQLGEVATANDARAWVNARFGGG